MLLRIWKGLLTHKKSIMDEEHNGKKDQSAKEQATELQTNRFDDRILEVKRENDGFFYRKSFRGNRINS